MAQYTYICTYIQSAPFECQIRARLHTSCCHVRLTTTHTYIAKSIHDATTHTENTRTTFVQTSLAGIHRIHTHTPRIRVQTVQHSKYTHTAKVYHICARSIYVCVTFRVQHCATYTHTYIPQNCNMQHGTTLVSIHTYRQHTP